MEPLSSVTETMRLPSAAVDCSNAMSARSSWVPMASTTRVPEILKYLPAGTSRTVVATATALPYPVVVPLAQLGMPVPVEVTTSATASPSTSP
jgi:hypothetical protein